MKRGGVVSCTRTPRGDYVCFTADFRTFSSKRLLKPSSKPPKPPENICMLYDILEIHETRDPERFIKQVGVPCRLTSPCTIYRYDSDKEIEIAESSVDDDKCRECLEGYPPMDNTYCDLSFSIIYDFMTTAMIFSMDDDEENTRNVYRSAVFIGKKSAYVAPWTADFIIYDTMRALISLGILEKDFEERLISKYRYITIHSSVGYESYGKIHQSAFNFYKHGSTYEAVAVFWTGSDRVARRYALHLWDLHENLTRKVIDTMDSLGDLEKLEVEFFRNDFIWGTLSYDTYFKYGKGIDIDDLIKYLRKIFGEEPTHYEIDENTLPIDDA